MGRTVPPAAESTAPTQWVTTTVRSQTMTTSFSRGATTETTTRPRTVLHAARRMCASSEYLGHGRLDKSNKVFSDKHDQELRNPEHEHTTYSPFHRLDCSLRGVRFWPVVLRF